MNDVRSVTLGGQNFPIGSDGVRLEDFGSAGGVFREAYDSVAARLQTADRERITQELRREYWAQMATPADTAAGIAAASTRGNARGALDPSVIAAEVEALRRTNPEKAALVEAELARLYPGAGIQSRIAQDIRTLAQNRAAADQRLQHLGAEAPALPADAPIISQHDLNARASEILADATYRTGGGKGQPRGDALDVPEVVYQIETLAASNPRLAQMLRIELSGRMSPTDSATFNRMLAGDTSFGEGIGQAFAHPVDGAIGAGKNLANGGIAIVDLMARGAILRTAGEQQLSAGLHSLIGNEEIAAQQEQNAAALLNIASQPVLPQIPYSNIAQSGGGDAGTIVEVAAGGIGIVRGGVGLVARNADEIAEAAGVAGRQADEIGESAARQIDEFDEIAANINIDMRHISDGHLNAKGKAVGFHSRPDAIDPQNSRMVEQVGNISPEGVYIGRVEIRDPATGQWIPKTSNGGQSTFYPDRMLAQDVEAAVRNAYADALRQNPDMPDGLWRGSSGQGFQIEGVVRNGEIVTAYPIF